MIKNINNNIQILPDRIITVDGYTASGKGVLCKYLQSFKNVENMCVDHLFHEISLLSESNRLSKEIGQYLFKIKINEKFENTLLSRNLNFRPYDDSSIFKTGKTFEYIKRLFNEDGSNIFNLLDKYKNNNFLLMSHFSMPFINFFFETLTDKLRFINIIRHPVYTYSHWIYLFESLSINKNRIYKFLNEYKGKLFFWFENPNEAYDMSLNERFISSILYLNEQSNLKKNNLKNQFKKNFKTISFEKFVMETDVIEAELIDFLQLSKSKHTDKIKKSLDLNQNFFSERTFIRGKKGWFIKKNKETQLDYEKKLSKIKLGTSQDIYSKFLDECRNYELQNSLKMIITN